MGRLTKSSKNGNRTLVRSFSALLLGLLLPSLAVCIVYGNCSSQLAGTINDGTCDEGNNNADCGYDGGDCCLCTCVHNVACAFVGGGFPCLDPDAGDEIHDCKQPPLATDIPCSSTTNQRHSWVVESTVGAQALADAILNCPGEDFDVDWIGHVVVEEPIYVVNGTVLTVNGVGIDAAIDGNGATRCFTVVNASLHVSDVTFTNGNATVGGAVAATGASTTLSFNRTAFIGNTAAGHGGALYVVKIGTALWSGESMFADNMGRGDGGAVYAADGCDVSWDGDNTGFFYNRAHADGGALYVGDRCNASWRGVTTFAGNTANEDGGAVLVWGTSAKLSWYGDTNFTGNSAYGFGGAILAMTGTTVTWDGRAMFMNNSADDGGALAIFGDVLVTWAREATFAGNRAFTFGGALSVNHGSHLSWNGTVSFRINSAFAWGGGVVVYNASISWDGDAIFDGNSVVAQGGALALVFDSNASWAGYTEFSNNNARDAGGAVAVIEDSKIALAAQGETIFTGNSAGFTGGALSVESGSSVSWNQQNVTFINNSADLGGALAGFSDCDVSWRGYTTFANNSAKIFGGALILLVESSALWDETTIFSSNSAMYGGIVHVYGNSYVSWSGDTTFANNNGSALYLIESSAFWDGKTIFSSNSAELGGAVAGTGGSYVSWSGDTTFANNSARVVGGALSMYNKSSASWEGQTAFSSNSAMYGGAVAATRDSYVSWSGDTTFANNSAQIGGGALSVDGKSITSWEGRTIFSINSAKSGGALSAGSHSNISWSTVTTFADNHATDYGGAVLLFSGGNVFWEGETTYCNNSANDGGAVYLLNGSTLGWSGRTDFLFNVAVSDGGAIGMAVYDLQNSPISSSLTIDGSSNFEYNMCGRNGGGLVLTGGVSTTLGTMAHLMFRGNFAGIAGGALFISGIGVGPVLMDVRFVSNTAQVGGAVYATGSGTMDQRTVLDVSSVTIPTTFDRCNFISNAAKGTGGAIEFAAGNYIMTNTSFVGNTARAGGALRLAGTGSLHNNSFVENSSDEGEGPAVSNIGYISGISNCFFVDNTFQCQPRMFLDYAKSSLADLHGTLCSGCGVDCQECQFTSNDHVIAPMCTSEIEHSISPGGNVTAEMLVIKRGYWRATTSSRNVLACYNADACLGGVTGAAGYCRQGHEGPYCSVCTTGYSASAGFTCSECLNRSGGIALAVFFAVLILAVWMGVIYYLVLGEEPIDGPTTTGFITRTMQHLPLQSIKIVIVCWQILTQFASVANVTYPDVYQRFLEGVNILNFDLTWVISTWCVFDFDFHDKLLLSTIGPLVVMTLLGATYIVSMRQHRGRLTESTASQAIRQKHLSMVLLMTFLVYSSVSSTVFRMFACETLDDDKTYLRSDYRIECNSRKHRALQIYAGFMICVYAVGIPVFYACLLFRNVDVLTNEIGRADNPRLKSTTDLWKPYNPQRFYYELVECGRRMLLTGVVVFIYPNTAAQVAVTLMIAVAFMVVAESLAPFASSWDAWISRTGHVIVFASVYVALLLRVDVSDERTSSQRVFEIVLIAAHAVIILAVVVEAIVMAYSTKEARRECDREHVWPKLRRGRGVDSFVSEDSQHVP